MADEAGDMPTRARRIARMSGMAWRVLSFVLAGIILYIFIVEWNRWEGDARWQTTDDAYLQTDLTPLSAQVSGYVSAEPVQDYEQVRAGQLIVQIDPAPYRAAMDQAAAQLAQVQAQRPLLAANLRAAQAIADITAAALAQNGRDVARIMRLRAGGSASTQDVEKLQTQRQQLQAQLAQNRAQADAVGKQIDLLASQEDAAKAALAVAGINLGYTRIVAPEDGTIGLRQVFPGQFIAAGAQVATLAALPRIWVLANYKETQLTRVQPGQRATITVDAFPGHTLRGHVVALSPASGALLALLPPDNTTGNFTKIVQRITVKIAIDDPGGLEGRLRPGMSAIPSIDTSAGQ